MKKVTYLFGAGASAKALPVVSELPDRINFLISRIKSESLWLSDDFFKDLPKNAKRGYQLDLIKDWEWLSFESSKHASVDTLAKKLFLKRKWQDLNRLKNALSMFFIFEQTRVPADIRYDTFFASILNGDSRGFPKNIRILSWNYDYQFERVYSDYSGWDDLEVIQDSLNIVSKSSRTNPPQDFAIIKLNGTTAFSDGGEFRHLEPLSNITVQFNIDTISALVNYYAVAIESNKTYYPLLSFAWENERSKEETILDKAITCTQDTDVLVVIGYSFPFFNREVDRKIIGAMKNLSKVYFQAPDAENIKTRFQAVRSNMLPKDLVAYPEVGSFLLPDEL